MAGKHAELEDGKPTAFISMQVLPANMQIIKYWNLGWGGLPAPPYLME